MLKSDISPCQDSTKALVVPGLFYFITLIFLFLYASLSEDSYLSWALLRGKAQQSTNSEMGNDLLPLALLYFFLAGAEHRKNSPLRCCSARFRTPQDPKAIPLVELFWYSIHAWSESRQPHLMISTVLTVTYTIFGIKCVVWNTTRSCRRHITEATHGQICIFLIFQLACYC